MGKEETLLKLKETEAQIRVLRDDAERDREQAVRAARREALELRDRMRAETEARYREILRAAESAVASDRERILATGRGEASKIAAVGRANVDGAVDHVLQKFRSTLHV